MQRFNAGRIRARSLALGLCATLVLPGIAGAAGWSADVSLTRDSNVTLAEANSDVLADTILSASLARPFQWSVSEHTRLVVRPFAELYSYNKYEELSHNAGGVNVTYQYRSSGRALAPTWGVFAKLWLDEYKSEFRDSTRFSFGINLRKAFTDRLTLASVLSSNERESDGIVWDTSDVGLLLNLDYQLARRATLYLTFDFHDGDIVSTAQPSLKIVNAAEAIQPDDAFGGSAANRFAYRLEGRTFVSKVGANFMLNETNSVDVSAGYATSSADGDNNYSRTILSIAYLTRF